MKKWTLKHAGRLEADELNEKLGISQEIGQILRNRGISTEEESEIFLHPTFDRLRDPFLMKDMDKAVERIQRAIKNGEKIWVYGDYDVDGVSSTSILCLYFRDIGYDVNYYIPNRLEEGYGINESAIRTIADRGADLIISVDCGITSAREVGIAKELGIDFIVTDHHECQDELPPAVAVVDPKQEDCHYPFDQLCGCGIAFKLIQALTPKDEFKTKLYYYIEIVALATICDVVSLKDENRIIVKNGLSIMNKGINIGLSELIKVCGIQTDKIGSSHIGYSVGPRINAAGRLGYSYLGVELFTTESRIEAKEIAGLLEEKNNERQDIELKIFSEAEKIIESDEGYKDDKVLVVASEGWQHGIIGIVASKLTEKYYKPTVMLCIDGDEATGSARSIKGFSIFEALNRCSDLMLRFGGHEQAAGLTLDGANIDKLRARVNEFADYSLSEEDMVENVKVEFELSESSADLNLVDDLHELEPFGVSNPTPKFIMRNCEIKEIRFIGKNRQHLKLLVEKKSEEIKVDSYKYECIGFNLSHLGTRLNRGDRVDILFQVDKNTFMGNTKLQFLLKDIRMYRARDIYSDESSIELMSKFMLKDIDEIKVLSKNSVDAKEDEKSQSRSDKLERQPVKFTAKTGELDAGVNTDIIDISGNIGIDVFDCIGEKTLVIANTVEGYERAVSDISLLEEEYEISYKKINKSIKDSNLQLIFIPYIDKIDLKSYNNIILYDYLFNIDDYGYIYENKDKAQVVNYYDETSLLYMKNTIHNLVPNRDDFLIVYKMAMVKREIEVDAVEVHNVFGLHPLKFFSIMNVFEELELLEYRYNDKKVFIKLMPKPNQKLDLNSSKILNKLNKIKDEFELGYTIRF
ncbi:MAG: single-stranded-DNA-specific exonuclease RecJ [Clostridioides sp.]|jgi:single-stranded-DNA-specific exonuclease|nr:single-stranded-DNA-specific exonuclease RecJ [Clostridioides sp.]